MNAMAPPPSTAWGAPAFQDAILAGKPFILLHLDQLPPGTDAAGVLDAAAAALAAQGVVFIRVANPLAAPLSVGRIMLQIAGTDDTDSDDDAARVMQALARKGRGASHLVVAVDNADTLAPTALSFLQLLAGSQAASPPPQIVFAGGTNFQDLLLDERFQIVRAALAAPLPPPVAEFQPSPQSLAQPITTPVEPLVTPSPSPAARGPRVLLRALQAVGVATAALTLLGLVSILAQRTPTAPRQEAPVQSAPVQSAVIPLLGTPPDPSPAPPTPAAPEPPPAATLPIDPAPAPLVDAAPPILPTATLPPAEPDPASTPTNLPSHPDDPIAERARLRREFDAFLAARTPASRRTSPAERDRLFREYLARRQDPTPIPTPTLNLPAVLIRYLATSAPAKAEARRIATVMQAHVTTSNLQPAPTVPPIPTIRYFYFPDRPAALALAAITPIPGGEWQVEDATNTPTRPAPGTLELWLP